MRAGFISTRRCGTDDLRVLLPDFSRNLEKGCRRQAAQLPVLQTGVRRCWSGSCSECGERPPRQERHSMTAAPDGSALEGPTRSDASARATHSIAAKEFRRRRPGGGPA
jgi:hypothetical protein